jgi:uncharacterized protein YxjI
VITYPLTLTFKFLTIGAHIQVHDADGRLVLYVKQKAFRLREDITIFADEAQTQELYRIRTKQIIDFGASYEISAANGHPLGAIRQRGMRSLWKATYDVVDPSGEPLGVIHEEDAWVKVLDGLIGGIPFVGWVMQQWINPAYAIDGADGTTCLRLRKRPSLIERRFLLEQEAPLPPRLEQLALPSAVLVVLLERGRG